MSHCQQSRVLEANPAIVHAALTTTESLRGWWVQDCDVQTKAVGTFRIVRNHKDMRKDEWWVLSSSSV